MDDDNNNKTEVLLTVRPMRDRATFNGDDCQSITGCSYQGRGSNSEEEGEEERVNKNDGKGKEGVIGNEGRGLVEEEERLKSLDDVDVERILARSIALRRRKCILLDEAPEFVVRLGAYREVRVGEGVTFTCQYRAFPPPTSIKWYKDEQELLPAERYKFESNNEQNGGVQLTIIDVREKDEGAYKCKVENGEGVASTTGYLSVLTNKDGATERRRSPSPSSPPTTSSDSSSPTGSPSSPSLLPRRRSARSSSARSSTPSKNLGPIAEQSSMEDKEEEACLRLGPSPLADDIDEILRRRKRFGRRGRSGYCEPTGSGASGNKEEREGGEGGERGEVMRGKGKTEGGEDDFVMMAEVDSSTLALATNRIVDREDNGSGRLDLQVNEDKMLDHETKENKNLERDRSQERIEELTSQQQPSLMSQDHVTTSQTRTSQEHDTKLQMMTSQAHDTTSQTTTSQEHDYSSQPRTSQEHDTTFQTRTPQECDTTPSRSNSDHNDRPLSERHSAVLEEFVSVPPSSSSPPEQEKEEGVISPSCSVSLCTNFTDNHDLVQSQTDHQLPEKRKQASMSTSTSPSAATSTSTSDQRQHFEFFQRVEEGNETFSKGVQVVLPSSTLTDFLETSKGAQVAPPSPTLIDVLIDSLHTTAGLFYLLLATLAALAGLAYDITCPIRTLATVAVIVVVFESFRNFVGF